MSVTVISWRDGAIGERVVGYASIKIETALGPTIIREIAITQRDAGLWASPPSRPVYDRDGSPMRAGNGKPRYAPILEPANRAAWSDAVCRAVEAAMPGVLK
jgi:hypothetical protein